MKLFAAVSPRIRLLVLTMLVFNVGFYLVLPFLAVHLTSDLGLAASWVGTVLGLRMLSQQGLFLFGGVIADRFGARRAVLAGIAVRVLSFVALGFVTAPALLVAAVIALGVAGALFTPAVEAVVAHEAERGAAAGGPSRTEVFALYAACSQLGTLVGPALGSLLVLGGFRLSCLVAAAVFAAAFVVHARVLPHDLATGRVGEEDTGARLPDLSLVLRNRRLLLFAVASSGFLAVYNQLYLALPIQLSRSTGSEAATGWLFAGSALLVVLLQLRVTAVVQARMASASALRSGFLLIAAAALLPALVVPGAGALASLAALTGFVLLLTVGEMFVLPAARDAVARIAGERTLGTAYGLVSTVAGVAVLLSSVLVGRAFDLASDASAGTPWTAALPWLLLTGIALASAVASAAVLRPLERTTTPPLEMTGVTAR